MLPYPHGYEQGVLMVDIHSSDPPYRILGREQRGEGDLLLKISLEPSDSYKIVLCFTRAAVESIQDAYPFEQAIPETLLLKNRRSFLNTLVKQALLDTNVRTELENRRHGLFVIDYDRWLSLKTREAEQKEQAHLDRLNDLLLKANL